MLRRQFELDDESLEELIEELVDIQRVAPARGKRARMVRGNFSGRQPAAGSRPALECAQPTCHVCVSLNTFMFP